MPTKKGQDLVRLFNKAYGSKIQKLGHLFRSEKKLKKSKNGILSL